MNATLSPPVRYPTQARQSPFYTQLRDQLLDSLGGGKPGDRVPSERQLAKQFDTSPVTIARVLQELQENGLLRRVPGKGTFICEPAAGKTGGNGNAGNGASGRTQPPAGAGFFSGFNPRVGTSSPSNQVPATSAGRSVRHTCILANLSSEREFAAREYWTHRLISTAERRLQRLGVKTTLVNRKQLESGDATTALDRLLAEDIDSLLYQGDADMWSGSQKGRVNWDREILQLRGKSESGLTVVRLNFGDKSRTPFDSVSFDGARGSFLATHHLLELGHREICFLTCDSNFPWVRERIEGFWQALTMAGVPTEEESLGANGGGRVYCSAKPPEEVAAWPWVSRDVVRRFFEDSEAPSRYTALVFLNDEIARCFIEEASRRGFHVPQDFAVIGFDDRLESKAVGLTTVHLPIEEMGETAVALMLQRHNEPFESGKIDVVLNPSLVVRSTTAQISREAN